MRAPGLPLITLFLALSSVAVPLRAGSFYEISWNSNRGLVTYDGTSLGAFTINDTSWSFQNVTVPGNFTWTMGVPVGVLDPATATSQTWTNGTGADALSATFLIPQPDGLGDFTVQPYVLDSTNLQPGGATFTVTANGSEIKYTAQFSFAGRYSTTATMSMSGKTVAGLPDTNSTSLVFRDGLLLITDKAAGFGAVVPEPSTGLATAGGGALLVSFALARRRRAR